MMDSPETAETAYLALIARQLDGVANGGDLEIAWIGAARRRFVAAGINIRDAELFQFEAPARLFKLKGLYHPRTYVQSDYCLAAEGHRLNSSSVKGKSIVAPVGGVGGKDILFRGPILVEGQEIQMNGRPHVFSTSCV